MKKMEFGIFSSMPFCWKKFRFRGLIGQHTRILQRRGKKTLKLPQHEIAQIKCGCVWHKKNEDLLVSKFDITSKLFLAASSTIFDQTFLRFFMLYKTVGAELTTGGKLKLFWPFDNRIRKKISSK